jgi:hypothetical protein
MPNVRVVVLGVVVVESAEETTAAATNVVVGADWCLCSTHGAVLLHSATSDAAVLQVLVVVCWEERVDDEGRRLTA